MELLEFAQKIGISEKMLLLFTRNASKHYREFWNTSSKRTIFSPNKNLKAIQRFIAKELLNETLDDCVHGYVSGRSIITNAQMHIDNRFVLVLDVKNFFYSIKKKHIVRIFSNFMGEKSSSKLAEICTYKGFLPQGAPSSPVLSNYFFKSYDLAIKDVCSRLGVIYTRYADDLTFSSNSIGDLQEIKDQVIDIVTRDNVFEINIKKTRLMTGKFPILITGINIQNSVLKAQKKHKKILRAMVFNKIINNDDISWNKISGLFNFILSIEPEFKDIFIKYIKIVKKKKRAFDQLAKI